MRRRKVEKVPGADDTHHVAHYIVGIPVPRWWVRGLSLNKRRKFCEWLANFWARANDNNVRAIERPRWLPKKYIYGEVRF